MPTLIERRSVRGPRWVAAGRDGFARWVEPVVPGLPRLRVLLALPALLLVAGVVLVGLALNGSSSGAFQSQVSSSADPDLISGTPQMIRTDEWYVQTSWAIAQVEQGLPVTNETFPGGMDATLPQDLPRSDWSVAFRPHLLGFNFLDVDHAIAWKWWMPGLALIAAMYCFALTVMPRRPLVAAALAVGFFYSPLFQWWYLATTLWPVVWALAAMTAITWSFASPRRRGAWVWAGLVGYLTVVMAMGIYVPYIVPVVIVVALYAVGTLVAALRSGTRLRAAAARFIPLITAGLLGSLVTGVWLATKWDTVRAFLGTAYPGTRLTPAGSGDAVSLMSALSSSFTQALQAGGLLGQNSSEVSTVFFVGAFLLPVVVWAVLRQRRTGGQQPWTLVALGASILLLFAFLMVPGWDAVAHLLLLDRSTGNRLRIGVAVASIAIVPLLVRFLDDERARAGVKVSLVGPGLFLLSQVAIAGVLFVGAKESFAAANLWWVFALLGTAAVYLLARSRPGPAVAAFLVLAVLGSATVNPLYRGVYDLRSTAVSKAIVAMDESSPSTWVGIGDRLTTAVLLESGVEAYNGFQGAPSHEMWDEIDPTGQYEFQWNRLAGILWTPGAGDPVVSNPVADQILVTFDACDTFAQENVDHVLSDRVLPTSACLEPDRRFRIASGSLTIYTVLHPADVPADAPAAPEATPAG